MRKNKDRFNLIVQSGANFHCSRFESSKFNPGERFTGVVPIREWIPEIQNLSPLKGDRGDPVLVFECNANKD